MMMYKHLMKIVTALMVCLLILIFFYLIAEALWSEQHWFGKIHEWGISEGIWVKEGVLFVTLVLTIIVAIGLRHERITSRRAEKEPPQSEKE